MRILCACGCGEQLPEKPYWYRKAHKYLPGHNNRTAMNRVKLRDSKLGDKNPMKQPGAQMKIRNARTGVKQPSEVVKNRNETLRRSWREDPKRVARQREDTKSRWANVEYVKKQMVARHVVQNKAEKLLSTLLTPGFRFVGDGQVIIAGKCPDFIDEEKHLIVELFGDYWHEPEEVEPRTKLFESQGYRTLVIWEHELKDPTKIHKKIARFAGSPEPV